MWMEVIKLPSQFAQITGGLVITPTVSNNQANEAIEEAVTRFISAAPPAILLLAYTTTNLPSTLMTSSIDCCIYWGFNYPLRQGANPIMPLKPFPPV